MINALTAAVGNTPLVELSDLPGLPAGTRLFAKLEQLNPSGSIKDRPVSRMMSEAIRRRDLANGRRLLDSSSGNAGIAYAMFGAAAGVGVTLVIPGNASRERLARIVAHGAEIITTDPVEGYDAAILEAQRLAAEEPDRYWYANQYANDDNWEAHYRTTGPEILEQVKLATGGPPDAFVAGVGTGGTLTGIGRRLKGARPDVRVAAVIPERFPGIEGLKPLGLPGDLVPEILDESLIEHRFEVTTDESIAMTAALARTGLFVGPSSGAYVHAAMQLARNTGVKTIVTILNDTGERYASTGLWDPPVLSPAQASSRSKTASAAATVPSGEAP
ncbi:MAG: PLP-dependent cysteine synthase family protein [Acidobacteria bacterium]|nr:PLP-dependent cysteine synthase family protein [Acidobacteriota bacterium]